MDRKMQVIGKDPSWYREGQKLLTRKAGHWEWGPWVPLGFPPNPILAS